LPLRERKKRLKKILGDGDDDSPIRYVPHFETGGDAVLESACRMSLEGIFPSAPTRPINRAAPMPGSRPSAAAAMKW
jgi:bifunctional non-homologous end joining protein LigD